MDFGDEDEVASKPKGKDPFVIVWGLSGSSCWSIIVVVWLGVLHGMM